VAQHCIRPLTRRTTLALGAGLLVPLVGRSQTTGTAPMNTRPIPSTGEALPVIGCGTYVGFDQTPDSPGYAELPGVVDALFAAGGSVIDSSPMYGRAEATAGEILAAAGRRAKAFVATKVWTRGRAEGVSQMQESMRLLKSERIDLMQIHNLVDWKLHLATLRAWKEQGRVRYIGITHYTASAYDEVEAVLRGEKLDFVQINYSIDERQAENRLLPLAAERGVAVLVNMPFGGGGLLRGLLGRPLPAWAADIGCSNWPQVLLKFVLSHPAVTCAIPGTRRPQHMRENAAAGIGPAPDAKFWLDKRLPA
jgi:diketogulonate reductase-like aldo/keto reductase